MLKSFLAGLTIGGVGALLSMQYHLVRSHDGVAVIPRLHQPPIRSVYADVRGWSPKMWETYPELTEAIVKSGRRELLMQDAMTHKVPDQPVYGDPEETVGEKTQRAMQALMPVQLTRQISPLDSMEAMESPNVMPPPRSSLGTGSLKPQPAPPQQNNMFGPSVWNLSRPSDSVTLSDLGRQDIFSTAPPQAGTIQPSRPLIPQQLQSAAQQHIVHQAHNPPEQRPVPQSSAKPGSSQERDWVATFLESLIPKGESTNNAAKRQPDDNSIINAPRASRMIPMQQSNSNAFGPSADATDEELTLQ